MRDWLIDYGSWGLAPFGLLGMIVVGQKRTWGWVVSMTTQTLWAFYAVGTGQYGFLIGTLSYFAVYLNNWVLWTTGRSLYDRLRRRTRPAPADPVLEALRAVYTDLDSTGRAGDEWAYAWVREVWPHLVPADVRVKAGDVDVIEEVPE